jgi:hypothetical protein
MPNEVTVPVPVDAIRVDGDTQARAAGLDPDVVTDYAEAIRTAKADGRPFPLPPVRIFKDGKTCWLADGNHTLAGAKEAGEANVPAVVKTGTKRDAILYAAGANAEHGLRRTDADKRRSVLMLLTDPEWSQWSDREVARRCHVGPHLVAKVRAELSVRGAQIAEDTRTVRRGGSPYAMSVANIGTRTAAEPPPADESAPAEVATAGEGTAAVDDPDGPLPFAGPLPAASAFPADAEPEKVELLNDSHGQAVPPDLVSEAKRHRRLRSIADAVRKAKGQWESEAGAGRADVGGLFDALLGALARESKFTVCPACAGLGTAGGCEGDTSACAGKGWLTADEFDRLPESHKRHALRFRPKGKRAA